MIQQKRPTVSQAFLILLLSLGWLTAQDGGKDLQEYRERFLHNFDRIGMNSTTDDARFLQMMIELTGAKRAVEVGSANGHGAMYMGLGLEQTGGKLTTIEIDQELWRECRENIRAMQLQETVECVQGDALQVLKEIEGPIDFVFIDAVKTDYFNYFRLIEDELTSDAVIVADNAIRAAESMRDFLDYLRSSSDYRVLIIRASDEKRDGMAFVQKLR